MDITVRPLEERDLPEADRIFRLAFGTFLGLPDPLQFLGDAQLVRPRWHTDPSGALAAELDGELVGSTFVANWGSVGFFGPLTIRPDCWNKGVSRPLLDATMEKFEAWGTRYPVLFTFAHSAKHLALYGKYGFAPRFLTPIMSKAVVEQAGSVHWSRYSELTDDERQAALSASRELTDAIIEGLDVSLEIVSLHRQALGDTILLWEGSQLAGFAVCHCGPGSEAGSDVCFVKFGAIRPSPAASEQFDQLLQACETFAVQQGLMTLVAGVNTGRIEAYGQMVNHGFRAGLVGVAMHKDNDPGYNRPGVFLLDDWR
jgi:GNAT superfamily N-acetyltransferase